MVPIRAPFVLPSLLLALAGAPVLAGDPPPAGSSAPAAVQAGAGPPAAAGATKAVSAPAPAPALPAPGKGKEAQKGAPAAAPVGAAPPAAATTTKAAPAPASVSPPAPPATAAERVPAPPSPLPPSGRFTDNATGLTFVFVKGGCFRMGNPDLAYDGDERPVHEVCLSPFWIAATEVTQEAWSKVMGWVPSTFKVDSRNPVEGISWNDSQAFVARMAEMTGRPFRLPTEAEWEYAARGGAPGAPGKEPRLIDVAWYDEMSERSTHPVAELDPNPLGLYDMQGNVWEWCSDWYGADYYRSSPKQDPKGPAAGPGRVLRGGSWADPPLNQRVTERGVLEPSDRSATHGFRPALSP